MKTSLFMLLLFIFIEAQEKKEKTTEEQKEIFRPVHFLFDISYGWGGEHIATIN